jgi:hypothetical protein
MKKLSLKQRILDFARFGGIIAPRNQRELKACKALAKAGKLKCVNGQWIKK